MHRQCSPEPGVMTRSFTFKFRRPAALPAGAILALLLLCTIAPTVAEAGCSHNVTSRTNSERTWSVIEPLFHDVTVHSEGPSVPPSPRPCTGALCSGKPAAPAVPAAAIDVQPESWAWNVSVPGLASTGASSLSSETSDLHPKHQAIAVFHPPRLLPSA
jgi:hypothetical protein